MGELKRRPCLVAWLCLVLLHSCLHLNPDSSLASSRPMRKTSKIPALFPPMQLQESSTWRRNRN
jgi:hypothetical protein